MRFIAGLLALYGVYAGLAVSHLHLSGVAACPTLGPVPACYLVSAGYSLMVIAMFRPVSWVFYAGWLPVFILAAMGVGLEIFSSDPVCPRTDSGIPKCYFSFALSLVLGLLGWTVLRQQNEGASHADGEVN